MSEVEHPDQDKYEAIDLTVEQWKQVIVKASRADGRDLHLYILKSWANQQIVTNGSINAFRGNVIEDVTDRKNGSTAIGNITRFVRAVTNNSKATCYEWNTIRGEWSIGTYQTFSLRLAFNKKRAPKGSEGIA
jgi:hypothetical protein